MTRRLHVVALGGTIASAGRHQQGGNSGPGRSDDDGVRPVISGEEITAAADLEGLFPDDGLAVSFDQLAQVGSPNITLQVVDGVITSCRRAREHGAEAAIVTQGTDSMEETAFALSLLNDIGIPIVVTGAMRHPGLPGADGPANVRAATLTAFSLADGAAMAAALVMNDEIHDPWFVRKTHTTSPATFTSGPVLGAVGWVSEDQPILAHPPRPRSVPSWSGAPDAVRAVPIVEFGSGDGPQLLSALSSAAFSGVVLGGLGGGHAPEATAGVISELAAQMPVVLSSRTGAGAVLNRTYSWVGGDIDLRRRGVISAGILDSRKARIALLLCLANDLDPAEVFAQHFQRA